MQVKVKPGFFVLLSLDVFIFLASMFTSASILFAIALMIWFQMFYYSYLKLESRGMLFAFCVMFFLVLMGRDLLEQFFNYKVESFSVVVNNHTYISYILALLSIWIGYMFFERMTFKHTFMRDRQTDRSTLVKSDYVVYIQKISYYIFILLSLLSIVYELILGIFVRSIGYYDFYMDYSGNISGNVFLNILSRFVSMMPIVFSIYLSTLPDKKSFRIPFILYMIYSLSALTTGSRSEVMLGILWMFVYATLRNELTPNEKWFEKKYLLYAIIAIPIIAILGSLITMWRGGTALSNINFLNLFVDAFYDEGVSTNVIKRAFIYADQIPGGYIYSMSFTRSGLIARILGNPIYSGNTVDHALYGGNLAYSLSYITMGSVYLSGRGLGSSYIAELFYDFGYPGIIFGSLIYSWLFTRFSKINTRQILKNSPLIFSVLLTIVTQLLWAPRGNYSGFLAVLFSGATVITYIIIFGLARLMVSRK